MSLALLSALILAGQAASEAPGVKCVLVLPPGAQPWPLAIERLDTTLKDVQWWYSCQMEAYGYGQKTFSLETGADGKVVVHVAMLDKEPEIPEGASRFSEPASGARSSAITAADKVVGDAKSRKGTVVVVVYDGYYWTNRAKLEMLPMGFGASGRWAHLSAWHLHGLNPKLFTNPSVIGELPEQNSYLPPLATKIYRAGNAKETVGERASGSYGTFFHEIGHSFGFHHPNPGDPRFIGDVMADYWQARGNFVPQLTDWCCITADEAAILNRNPLFQVRKIGPSSTGASRKVGARGAFDPAKGFAPGMFAPINLDGKGFSVEAFGSGLKSQSNRDYVWKDVPSPLEGYKFTKTAGGVASTILAQALGRGRIYVATTAAHASQLESAGWQLLPSVFAYSSSDGKRSYAMYMYFREVVANQVVSIPQCDWSGTILIAPARAEVGEPNSTSRIKQEGWDGD